MIGHDLKAFWSVLIVVAYSIALFWLGSYVERRSLNQSLAFQNFQLLEENAKANDEILRRLRDCGK